MTYHGTSFSLLVQCKIRLFVLSTHDFFSIQTAYDFHFYLLVGRFNFTIRPVSSILSALDGGFSVVGVGDEKTFCSLRGGGIKNIENHSLGERQQQCLLLKAAPGTRGFTVIFHRCVLFERKIFTT